MYFDVTVVVATMEAAKVVVLTSLDFGSEMVIAATAVIEVAVPLLLSSFP